jgi:hypothetical protein
MYGKRTNEIKFQKIRSLFSENVHENFGTRVCQRGEVRGERECWVAAHNKEPFPAGRLKEKPQVLS